MANATSFQIASLQKPLVFGKGVGADFDVTFPGTYDPTAKAYMAVRLFDRPGGTELWANSSAITAPGQTVQVRIEETTTSSLTGNPAYSTLTTGSRAACFEIGASSTNIDYRINFTWRIANVAGPVDQLSAATLSVTFSNGVTVTLAGGGGTSLPVDDTTALVRDPADTTKRVRIDAGAVATATTRTITMGDRNVDLASGGTFAENSHTHNASDLDAGTLADARVAESNVTQHRLPVIRWTGNFLMASGVYQVTGDDAFARLEGAGVTITLDGAASPLPVEGDMFLFVQSAGAANTLTVAGGATHDSGPTGTSVTGEALLVRCAGGDVYRSWLLPVEIVQPTTAQTITGAKTLQDLTLVKGSDVASGATLAPDFTTGNYFDVTGTTTITAITAAVGRFFALQFDGALTLTHHATNLNLPGSANITTAAGDVAVCFAEGANQVRVVTYRKQDGTAVVGGAGVNYGQQFGHSSIFYGSSAAAFLGIGYTGNLAAHLGLMIVPWDGQIIRLVLGNNAGNSPGAGESWSLELYRGAAGATPTATGEIVTVSGTNTSAEFDLTPITVARGDLVQVYYTSSAGASGNNPSWHIVYKITETI